MLVVRRVGATVAYRELCLRSEGVPNMYGVDNIEAAYRRSRADLRRDVAAICAVLSSLSWGRLRTTLAFESSSEGGRFAFGGYCVIAITCRQYLCSDLCDTVNPADVQISICRSRCGESKSLA